jgi:hypothetical protein
MLALISHDRNVHSLANIATIFGVCIEDVRQFFESLSFIVASYSDGDTRVDFVSDSFRRYAASRLADKQEKVRKRQIDWLVGRPESDEALALLPEYLGEAGRRDELLAYLSPEHFGQMVEKSQSLGPVKGKAELGLNTALKAEKDPDLFRFAIQKCAIAELDGCEISRSEVEARVVTGEYGAAMELAQSAVLKQDRLRLFAVIARAQSEQGLSPEPELLEQIRQLSGKVETVELGDRLVELAADLMYSSPELALQLVERATPNAPGDRAMDWALARLSVEALIGERRAQGGMTNAAADLRVRIKDPAAFRFSTQMSILLGRYSARELIREAERLENPSDRLYLLRLWADKTRTYQEAGEVVEYALKLAIKTTNYTPTATDLRELATPVPYVPDAAMLRRLIGTFDAQKEAIERVGPTVDYVRLQLQLCQADARYDRVSASQRLVEIYYYVDGIGELELKTACLGYIAAAIPAIDPDLTLKEVADVSELSHRELERYVRQLLDSTADHYMVTMSIIAALAKAKPQVALSIARELNTEPRRDAALSDLIDEWLDQPARQIPFSMMLETLTDFADLDDREASLAGIFERLAAITKKTVLDDVAAKVLPLVGEIEKMEDKSRKCYTCCHALLLLSKADTANLRGLMDHIYKVLDESWNAMDDSSAKVEVGFRIAALLAPNLRAAALSYVARSQRLREQLGVDYEVSTYTRCLSLAVRAFSGLLPQNLDSEDDYGRLTERIQRLPSRLLRVQLWTDLALRCFGAGRSLGDRIVTERIQPLLGAVKTGSKLEWFRAVATAAPALYRHHHLTALELFRQLPRTYRDVALDAAIDFINRKVSAFDPFDAAGSDYPITYEEAIDVCELLGELDTDATLFGNLKVLVSSALLKHGVHQFTENERLELAQRLARIVEEKFPNPRFIRHEGYRVIAKGQIARLTRRLRGPQWEELVGAGRRIPNLSDRVFVLANLGELSSDVGLLREAKGLADQIPSAMDRIDRYDVVASGGVSIDQAFSTGLLKEAAGLLKGTADPDAEPIRRRMVDLAYRIDPDLASSLASLLDQDQARMAARERLRVLQLKKQLADNEYEPTERAEGVPQDLAKAASLMLAGLNANRIQPKPVRATREFIVAASTGTLDEAYPVLSWLIENAIHRRGHAREAKSLLRGLFEAVVLGCDLAYVMAARSTRKLTSQGTCTSPSAAQKQIVHAGMRNDALDYLRAWLRANATDYLKVCDPFFGPADLEVLQLVLATAPKIRISVVTSKKHQEQERVPLPWDEAYRRYWRDKLSDQSPPETEIVIVGTQKGGELPIHDRWWLTRGKGLRFGSSFNSLGEAKDSEVSILTAEQVAERETETDQYLRYTKREHLGERLSVTIFSL